MKNILTAVTVIDISFVVWYLYLGINARKSSVRVSNQFFLMGVLTGITGIILGITAYQF